MYVRQFKQFIKTFDDAFDERRYGFAGIVDALRFGQREGLFRLERDRQGVVRVHPGVQYVKLTKASEGPGGGVADDAGLDQPGDAALPREGEVAATPTASADATAQAASDTRPFDAGDEAGVGEAAADTPEASVASESGDPDVADTPGSDATSATPQSGRKRTGARKSTRAKKTVAPVSSVKKKTARPRASKA